MGALLFDSNNNSFLDLYVVSGGSRYAEGGPEYQDRLYINDGNGNFSYKENALPTIMESGSKVTAADFDGDGDLDLFVGGRVVPGSYPTPPKSYLLENNGGVFKDITEEAAPELQNLGLVTDAIWTDYDGDGRVDLIVVGEWMPITFFKNQGGKLENITLATGMENTAGWWNSIHTGDFNEDGKVDYIVGNLGLNSKFKASAEFPVQLYADDFDNNQSIDPIMTRFVDGIEFPVHPRDNLIGQIPSMKRRLPKYGLYGAASIQKVLDKGERENAYKLQAGFFETAYLENLGGGKFSINPLPIEAQISPTFGIIVRDFTGNGHDDVLLSGNSYSSDILSGWYDAGIGQLLEGDGNGGFLPIHHTHSGFFVDQDSKGMVELNGQDGKSVVLVASNDGHLTAFQGEKPKGTFLFSPKADDQTALLHLENGKSKIIQLGHGSSYLSQSSRKVAVPSSIINMTVTNFKGESRTVELP
jgi:enediyne biosynthesis protein E4